MKKRILFPTDFTINSLNLVKSVLSKKNGEFKYDVLLLHGIHLSTSITDLLFYSKEKMIEPLTNPEFDDACNVIKNKFDSQIIAIRKDVFTGFTQSAFNNFIEGNKIEKAYIPTNYSFVSPSKKSFDVIPFIKKSNLEIDQIELTVTNTVLEKETLAEFVLNGLASS